MNKQTRFFLIHCSQDFYWPEVLVESLAPLGHVQVGTETDACALVDLSTYDLILVDSAAVANVASLVASIRTRYPDARILVVAASPTWERARAAFKAGAVDYIRKPFDREEILVMVQGALKKILPSWPSLIASSLSLRNQD